jgi:hypothetical protein
MKKTTTIGILSLGLLVTLGVYFTSAYQLEDQPEKIYTPRNELRADNAKDAAVWLLDLQKNPQTGKVDPQDVLKARLEVSQMQRSMKTSALGLQWEVKGPDNVGGRTRTLFIDPDNPSFMLAGSVSGGIYKSTTGGSSWQLVDGDAPNNAITYITKSVNGDYYVSTGEALHYGLFGYGAGGMLGQGIYKSTDGGNTFSLLPSTFPTPNSTTTEWAAISFVIADPIVADRIYASTNLGMRRSDDGGNTWVNPVAGSSVDPSEINGGVTDFSVASDGSIWVKSSNQVLFSPDGSNGSFVQISGIGQDLPPDNNRGRIAVAPSDPNKVYVVYTTGGGSLEAVYRSEDRGATWTFMIAGSPSFDPLVLGDYALLFNVDPNNPDRFLLGGIDLWSWSVTEGWRQIATRGPDSPTNPFYVHADNHDAIFHPTNPNIIYVVNDGGIFRSANNGFTWNPVNTFYTTLQLYSVIGDQNGRFLGGSQDNGTIAIIPGGDTAQYGLRTVGIDFQVSADGYRNMDGDGGYVEASSIVPKVLFKSMQHGIIGRSENEGETFESFYQFNRMDPQFISGTNTSNFSNFITPFELWESNQDVNSTDSVQWNIGRALRPLGFASLNDTVSRGTINLPQPSAEFIPEQFRVVHGPLTLVSDANGNLSGDGTGSFNPQTGEFVARFNRYFSLEVNASCGVRYDAGDEVYINSASFDVPFDFTVPRTLESGDSIMVQDIVQSAFFVGLRGRNGFGGNNYGGVWMTREVWNFNTPTLEWWQILDIGGGANGSGDAVRVLQPTEDGNTLWVGLNSGRLYRIGNLNQARSRETADVQNANPNRLTTIDLVGSWIGRSITAIALDPNDNDKLMVTLGNFGANTHIFYSTNAMSATPVFQSKQGNLPDMPVYSGMLNFFNGQEALVGTEYGVFSTSDITAVSPVWTPETNGFQNVPVFMIRQGYGRRNSYEGDTLYSGYIDLATHGRGFVRSTTLQQMNPIGVNENDLVSTDVENVQTLKLYPNPAETKVSIEVEANASGTIEIEVRDINGRIVRQESRDVRAGVHTIEVELNGLASGVYIARAEAPGFNRTARFIKR